MAERNSLSFAGLGWPAQRKRLLTTHSRKPMNQHILGTTALLLAAATASAQWHQAAPSASPTARGAAGMAYDPTSGNVLMFGGDTGAFPSPASNQTWSYNGSTWTQLTPTAS